jgi:rubrerythrin
MAENKTEKSEELNLKEKTEVAQSFAFCPRCGNTITGDMVNTICPQCGYRFCPSCID